MVRGPWRGFWPGFQMTLDEQDIAIARGLILLALILTLVSIVFRMGISIGWRASAEDMQWSMEQARRVAERERAERS